MDLLQSWLIVGIPGLVAAGALFVGRSQFRALFGYALLFALVLVFALTPGGAISAAAVGVLVVGLVGAGRGTGDDRRAEEHHRTRRRFTTAADSD